MAKFYGNIGYTQSIEKRPGYWKEEITERPYYGELVRNTRRLQAGDKVNDDINVANEISIVADPFANENFYSMKYVTFNGAKWKISNIEVRFPRLVLTLGGLYNDGEST